MYKMILVDDEEFVLENISKSFYWEDLGFELSATFSSPVSALAYIRSNPVHAVITDIKMPHMDGLALARAIREFDPCIRVVLLSGYTDFAYAKAAIKENVFDYLLKPLSYESMQQLCKRLYAEIKNVLSERAMQKIAQLPPGLRAQASEAYRKRNTFDEEITGVFGAPGWTEYMSQLPAAVFFIKISDLDSYLEEIWSHGKNQLFTALENLLIYSGLCFIPLGYTNQFLKYAVIIADNSPEPEKVFWNFRNTFTQSCFEILNLSVILDFTVTANGISALDRMDTLSNQAQPFVDTVLKIIADADAEKALSTIRTLQTHYGAESIFMNMFAFLLRRELSEQQEHDWITEASLADVRQTNLLSGLEALVRTAALSADKNAPIVKADFIPQVQQYLDTHFTENITLLSVAEQFYISQSHLSRLFKKYIGCNFIEYINRLRMEKSKELLAASGATIADIAKKVGYLDTRYFYKKFKASYGLTPQQYRLNQRTHE